ncbi:MAG: hypothetical protein E7581_02785 [Ruminococcaceae bacterium]|nr:hypothetical protein [Oscillospiraceae bacterium]
MKDYLSWFFANFSYDAADSAALLAAYDKLMANPEAAALLEGAIATYEADINCDYNALTAQSKKAARLASIHNHTTDLLLFICLSKHLRELYAQRGIDDAIWHDTVLDLKYKLEECKLVRGVRGMFVAFWMPGWFKMTRFALGRLQFEIVDFGREYQKDGITLGKESKVLNMHIPRSGLPLSKELYEDSFARAKAFFQKQLPPDQCPDGKVPFVCHSWLLYPRMTEFVSERSNVLRFMKEFEILSWDDSDGESLWCLFDTAERNPDRLPTNTSLRRAFVQRLKSGGRVGWGYGILFR